MPDAKERPPNYPWLEKKTYSAVPDPYDPKCHDIFYRGGKAMLRLVPGLKERLHDKAPPDIKVVKGGVERTCFLIVIIQLLVGAAYAYTLYFGFVGCKGIRYLSLVQVPVVCNDIKLSINDQYYLDDQGFWVRAIRARNPPCFARY